jgi:hypothetical protein
MRHYSGLTRWVPRCLAALIVLGAATTSASAQALGSGRDGAFLKRPLTIKDQGSFFIGGVNKTTQYATNSTAGANASIVIGQMYVQFQIPEGWNNRRARREGKWPVIMVHGSTHTGAALESTPEYKEGWAPYYVRNGLPVFVVDQAGRGRSGFDESVVHEGKRMFIDGDAAGGTALIPNFGRITSNGSYTAWFGHLVVPNTATTCTDILTCELMPHGWRPDDPSPPTVHPNPAGYLPAFPLSGIGLDPGQKQGGTPGSNTPPGVAPIGLFPDPHFGPTPYGPEDAYALHYYKQLVPNAEVTLPGSVCPTCVPPNLSASNTWTPFALALLVERIGAKAGGAVVATHSQSGIMGHHMARLLKQRGNLNYLKGLITVEGGCSFAQSGLTAADFDNIPYMAIKGDYTVTSAACTQSVAEINARRAAGQGSACAEYIQLDEPKWGGRFNGVTHMMMDDLVALPVADVMLDWGDRCIQGERGGGGGGGGDNDD